MTNRSLRWLSGALGFLFFTIANFTDVFIELNLFAGVLHIAIAASVSSSWFYGALRMTGKARVFGFSIVAGSCVMIGVTLTNVLIPALFA